jgi:hypothetical protein
MTEKTKTLFNLSLPNDLKAKLLRDSALYGFATPTAYLNELIERGLPVSKAIDTRLKAIEEKQDEFAGEMTDEVLALHKRLYLTYRLAAKTLIHSFFIKPGPVTDEAVAEAKALIDEEIENTREAFEDR